MATPIVRLDTASLTQQGQAPVHEGGPPLGGVGIDPPCARPKDPDGGAKDTPRAVNGTFQAESLEALEQSIRTAEEERDALDTLTQEEMYLGACLRVDALERQLELRLAESTGSTSPLPEP